MLAAKVLPLTAIDRCDRCGAQAYVRTDHGRATLLWCAHHWREHGETVVAKGGVVVNDDTDSLPRHGLI